jgi:peptide/nickel transport system substrate-binding protein
MLEIHAEHVFAIGTIARAPMPVVADETLRNVPEEALYAWDPGAQLGIHRMDEFWFDDRTALERADAGAVAGGGASE